MITKPRQWTERPGTFDTDMWASVVDFDEYKLRQLNAVRGATVVDVGAHIGCFSAYAAMAGAKRVLAFEAEPDNFRVLQENTAQFPSVAVANLAVWRGDRPGEQVYFHPSSEAANTGGGNVLHDAGVGGTVAVDSIPLDEIIGELGYVDLLKLDCEGSEFPILYTSQRLGDVKYIVGEYHEWPQPPETCVDLPPCTIDALERHLIDQGFAVLHQRTAGNLGLFWATR